jgi:hypothetical protein
VDQPMKQSPTRLDPTVYASDGFALVERPARELNAARPSCGVKAPGCSRPITTPAGRPPGANADGQTQRPSSVQCRTARMWSCMAKDTTSSKCRERLHAPGPVSPHLPGGLAALHRAGAEMLKPAPTLLRHGRLTTFYDSHASPAPFPFLVFLRTRQRL